MAIRAKKEKTTSKCHTLDKEFIGGRGVCLHAEVMARKSPPSPFTPSSRESLGESDKAGQVLQKCFQVLIMLPCRAGTLLSTSTLSERSEDGDYGSDLATARRRPSVSRVGSEGHYGACAMKSLTPGSRVSLASDRRSQDKQPGSS